ncbi:MAG: Na+/H+ antiporter subunit E [Desulfovermiculus sp.]
MRARYMQTRKGFMNLLGRGISFLLTFGLMFLLWIIFSGMFEPLLLWLGVVSCLIVAAMSHMLIFPYPRLAYIAYLFRFAGYLPWLILKVFQANIHLLKIIFHPRMMDLIDPHIVTFQTNMRADLSITAMANSMTLTPGTITVSADQEGRFRVHAIDRPSAEELPGKMGQKVQRVFEG